MLSETIAFLNDNAAHVDPLITGNIIMLSPHHSLSTYHRSCSIVLGYLARPEGRSCCSKVTFGNKELSLLADEERWVDRETRVPADTSVSYLSFILYMNIRPSCISNLFAGMFLLSTPLTPNEDLRNLIYNLLGHKLQLNILL